MYDVWPRASIVAAVKKSIETAVGSPQLPGAAGSFGHQSRQLFPVGNREGDVRAAAAGGRSAIRLRREVPVPEEADVERRQQELLSASSVCPAKRFRDRDVDRQGTHVNGDVAAHGRMVARAWLQKGGCQWMPRRTPLVSAAAGDAQLIANTCR